MNRLRKPSIHWGRIHEQKRLPKRSRQRKNPKEKTTDETAPLGGQSPTNLPSTAPKKNNSDSDEEWDASELPDMSNAEVVLPPPPQPFSIASTVLPSAASMASLVENGKQKSSQSTTYSDAKPIPTAALPQIQTQPTIQPKGQIIQTIDDDDNWSDDEISDSELVV